MLISCTLDHATTMSQTSTFIMYSDRTDVVSREEAEAWMRLVFSIMKAEGADFTFYFPHGCTYGRFGDEPCKVEDHFKLSMEQAISLYQPGAYLACADFKPITDVFGRDFESELQSIDPEIRHNAIPCNAGAGVGQGSIHISGHTANNMSTDALHAASMTHATTNMTFSIWGYGMPIHPEEFGDCMMELGTIKRIREQLETIAGPMKHYVSLNF